MLFFILLYFLKIKEGYTDSFTGKTVDSINKTKENVIKTIDIIKDLSGKNVNSKISINLQEALGSGTIQDGLETDKYKKLNPNTLSTIENQRTNINSIQYNINQINDKMKDMIETTSVSIIPLNDTKPVKTSLSVALDNLLDDLNTISKNLKQIPDK